jgi:opacity protein-like surface antigen
MKQISMCSAFLLIVASIGASASEFEGTYVGVNLGHNRAAMGSNPIKNSTYLGLKAGYNWDLGGLILGGEVFVANHASSYTGPDEGAAARFGLPVNRWLPYVKLGVVGNDPGYRAYGGLGVAYALGDRWSANAEWTADSRKIDGVSYKNNNISIGLNFSLEAVRCSITPDCAAHSPDKGTVAERAASDERAAEARGPASDKAPASSVYRIFF